MSADGNTAIIGAPNDDWTYDSSTGQYNIPGAAWVFVRSNGVWTQQGGKLFGSTTYQYGSEEGTSVAISGTGNTVLIGGPYDEYETGAAWVFTRSNGIWTQFGDKLVGSGSGHLAYQGSSVALSADGNTAIMGGPGDANGVGAAWVFTQVCIPTFGCNWIQQGNKLVGTAGNGGQGTSVALSADGNTAIVGSSGGIAWIFTRSQGNWAEYARFAGNRHIRQPGRTLRRWQHGPDRGLW